MSHRCAHQKVERPFCILGTGHALPALEVPSEELDRRLRRAPGSIERASGVRKRYFAARDDTAAKLAARAARDAIEAAGIGLSDIDCLVAASGTPDQALPCNAALIHHELRLSRYRVPAFDVNASCMSFIAALETLSWPIAAGEYRRVLVASADIASCALDWDHLEASAIFGDGAAAAVVGRPGCGAGSRLLATSLCTLSEGVDLCEIPAGGSRNHPSRADCPFERLSLFRMDGKGVYKLAAEHMPSFVESLLSKAGVTKSEIDWVVPHQASHLALKHLVRRLGFRPQRVVDIFADHGNQVGASLPTALDCAIRDGRIRRGQRVMLLGTGAGLSIGGMVLEY